MMLSSARKSFWPCVLARENFLTATSTALPAPPGLVWSPTTTPRYTTPYPPCPSFIFSSKLLVALRISRYSNSRGPPARLRIMVPVMALLLLPSSPCTFRRSTTHTYARTAAQTTATTPTGTPTASPSIRLLPSSSSSHGSFSSVMFHARTQLSWYLRPVDAANPK